MTFGDLFAGIGGFSLGLERAGMTCRWQVEVDGMCRSVLRRHHPESGIHKDVREFDATKQPVPDLICGGFPCQDLSVAGRRAGLAGKRSSLFHEFMRVVAESRPGWVLIENVPGLLSSNGGRDMGTILGRLGECGYRWAYRVLDAQYFGVAQRRRRVFIVGSVGDRPHPAEILFDSESLSRNPPARGEEKADVAASLRSRSASGRGVNAPGRGGEDDNNIVMASETGRGYWTSDGKARPRCSTAPSQPQTIVALDAHMGMGGPDDNAAQAGHLVAFAQNQLGEVRTGNVANTLNQNSNASDRNTPMIAYQCHGSNVGKMGHLRRGNGNETGGVPFVFRERTRRNGRTIEAQDDVAYALTSPGEGGRGEERNLFDGMSVRRLTPIECERLQGFPDGWTEWGVSETGERIDISDSARYRMIGNAVAVPVAEWIGRRILQDEIDRAVAEAVGMEVAK